MLELSINGKTHAVETDDDTLLLWLLRDRVGLTGTKYGCGSGY
jgi:isoquinoline 1-oxidoreductase alpha subunit